MKKIVLFLLLIVISVTAFAQGNEGVSQSSHKIAVYVSATAPMKGSSYALAAKIRGGLKGAGCSFASEPKNAMYAIVADAKVEKYSETSFAGYDGSTKTMYVVFAKVNLAIKNLDTDEIIYNDELQPEKKIKDSDYNRAATKAYDELVPLIIAAIKSELNI